jgi:MYXO-CTERM domain-containing protein
VICRAAAGACDAEERCSGGGATCPADVALADGTTCGDGPSCDGVATCQAGACQPPATPLCGEGFTCEEATATCVPVPADPADGCGCQVGGRPASGRSLPALGLGVAALLGLGRRRRRRAVG